jgi:hypothetical protein
MRGCLLSALLLLGCEGSITGQDGVPPPTGPGPGVTQPGPNLNSGPTDDELRARDPQLFEIALRYFPGQTATAGSKRLFRLTRTQLDLTTQSLLPQHAASSALATLPRDPLQTNYEYAANLGFSASNFTPLTQLVDAISASVKQSPQSVIDCQAQANAPTCLEQSARSFVSRAFRGIVSDTQLTRLASFFSSSVSAVGIEQATADLVNVTLTSPGYVFRDEVQTDGMGRLLPAQRLQQLSYVLTDSPPEAVGLTVPARDAKPLADADFAKAVDAVLSTPAARSKLVRFFESWLEIREPDELDISTEVFPEFTPEVASAVVADTRAFLDQQLQAALPTLRDVTEASAAVVSQPSAFLYGIAPTSGRVELDPAQRLGIFSQPAVIASHSGPTTTRLVKRGVFFTRKVMCLPLGVPPADVDTTVPEDAGGTERQRIESVTQPARCAACHAFINPFGFMQENYDALGRYRTEDEGQPIDASISVDFLDEGPLATSSPVEALRGFTRSWRFQQCFTRQLFRFYMGRDETEGDDPLLRQLFFEFAQNQSQSMLGMLRSLASSASFSVRAEVP